ncbi:WecB/TagA/CpsF family glycosyltransferase [Luteolibacter yonseiensis]|uniref:WecB/TagA/CpsF family glycosyltransferase n=1 Tax=Luteolibacter yonseiensis TaxID=1144680 RepID=A0A934R6I0_9BACT|nr:WecB/TagA/CpsF family glycosyltransferase [Luteolibacter yonseiensis]MBK1817141.1 WecB/TagA/CpsF family glycosyltransferase [Luteolibacter yonseiensis]
MSAYQASDWAVVDGGYVALVLRMCFGRHLPRISGLQILQRLVGEKSRRSIPFHERRILWVVPTAEEKDRIDYYLEDQGFPHQLRHWYYAPFYRKTEDFQDEALAAKVAEVRPDWIILCIAGGKQEKLGHFLRSLSSGSPESGLEAEGPDEASAEGTSRPKGPVILCTGGAIAFLSGGQANIPTWADRLYLGWFFRITSSPKVFLPRYWVAAYEFPLLLWERRGSLFVKKGTE